MSMNTNPCRVLRTDIVRLLPGATFVVTARRISQTLLTITLVVTALTVTTGLAARPKTTRMEAIAIVKSILQRNSSSCKFRHGPIIVERSKAGWRVSSKLTLSGRGKPFTAAAVWTVRENDGEAVPGNQLTAEISSGCP